MKPIQSDYRFTFTSVAGEFDVILFKLKEGLSQTFHIKLHLSRMKEEPVSFSDILDNPGTLIFWKGLEPIRYLNGVVSYFHRGGTGHRRTNYTAVITPTYSRTQLYSNLRIYQEKTVPDIMKIILGTDGIAPVRFDLEGDYLPREFCVQYRETDKNFIERLAAEEGIFYYFEHDKTSHTLVFTDNVGTLASLGEVYHNPNISGARTEPSLWFFEYQETVATAKYKMRDRFFEKPDYDLEQKKTGQNLDNQKTSYERYDYPGRYKEDAAGKPFTDFRLEYERRETQVATAVSDELKLIAGKHITLSQAPTANQQTNWLIVSAIHTGTQPQSQEEDSAGGGGSTYDNRLQLIPEGLPWRAEQQPKPRVDGPQIAEISGPPGEEIYCDEYGRVKVKFLWDLEGPSDDKSSCWIRVSQYWASTKWGGMAIPRIGQEVIVSFLEGDPDQPIVTGRTYNANNMPPYDLPANKTKMTIKSRTHKGEGFNEFRFEDEAGKEEIFIHAQLDQNNVVRNDETTDVGRDRTEHIKHNETITIDNDRLENVKHNETITIDNDRTETVKNDERITIDNDRIELVKNDETVTIKNDQHTHIKNNQYEDVDGDKHNKVKGDRLEKITGSSHLKITGSQNEEITQSVSRDTKMSVQEKMGLKYAVDAGTEVHLKAGLSAVIEATASITLQVGESVININPAGVFIDGPIVLIKSGALAVPGTGSNPDGADSAEAANRAVANNNPNTEDIEYDGTVGGDNARHPLETEAAPPEIAGDDAIDFAVKEKEPEPVVAEVDDGFGVDDGVSMGLDFIPFVGAGKSIAQLISGTDLITGESTPRWIEAVGILAGVFGAAGIAKGILKGGSSVLKHGDEVADVAEAAVKKADDDYGVAFFGEDNLAYYTRENATIGREGKSFFLMPLEDSAIVKNASDAARYTGRAPSAEKAYLEGGDVFGLSFPTKGMKTSKPTVEDAGGWPHFLEGGHTAVKTGDGANAGYLVNPTREFVTPGGKSVPEGSTLFKLGVDGEWLPIKKF